MVMLAAALRRALYWVACVLAAIPAWPPQLGSRTPAAVPSPVLATVQVGTNPIALAIDEQTGRVFVLNGGLTQDENYLLNGPGSLSVLDAATGRLLRTTPVGHGMRAIAVDRATNRVFVTDQTGMVLFQARSGARLGALRLNGGAARGLAVDERRGAVFVATRGVKHGLSGSGPASISVLDATSGMLRRTFPVEADRLAVDERTGRLFVQAVQCTNSAAPYAVPACVATLDAATGRQRAFTTLPDFGDLVPMNPDFFALAVDERASRVVVQYGHGRGGSYVTLLDALTGRVRATPATGGCSVGSIAVDAPRSRAFIVMIGADNGGDSARASVVDTRSGRVLNNILLAKSPSDYMIPAGIAVDSRRGRVYVVTNPYDHQSRRPPPSTLSVLDGGNGRILRTLALPYGAAPLALFIGPAMAVDEKTARLFIANGDDNSVSVLDTARLCQERASLKSAAALRRALSCAAGAACVLAAMPTPLPQHDAQAAPAAPSPVLATVRVGPSPVPLAVR